MKEVIYVLNAGSVGFFGAFLSASFCDIKWTKKNKTIFLTAVVLLAVLQAFLYGCFGQIALRKWYPVITHLPLMVLLGYMGRRWWSIIAVLSAYLCCQLRRWIALLCVEIYSGTDLMQDSIEFIVTIPMLVLIIKYVSPSIRNMSRNSRSMQLYFSFVPAINYFFDYATRIYTNWLVQGVSAAVEFMPFVCSSAYLFFAIYSSEQMRKQSELEQMQAVLNLQIKQADNQISDMRKSQEMAAAYRHDLRHHMQYVSACIKNNALDQAQEYIFNLTNEITNQTMKQYCENTSANLVISAYAGRAADADVAMNVKLRLQESLPITESDFCVLLSNALENALNACIALRNDGGTPFIKVSGYEKNEKLFLEIINSCDEHVNFENGLPVTKKKGHGMGVRSICAVVDKYNGIYSFETRDNCFILRLHV